MRIRKAVFPVAGMGTRFLPATKASAKEMLPVVDKPLIQYAVQEAISAAKLKNKVGQVETVLVDEVNGDEAIGRTRADAPDIDGVVYLAGAEGLVPGDLVEAQIVNSDGHDLWAAPPERA